MVDDDARQRLPDPTSTGTGPKLSFGVWLAVVLGLGLLLFGYHHLAVIAAGGSQPWILPLITELSAAFNAGLLFFGVLALVRRYPPGGPGWPRRVPLYLGAFIVFAVSFTTMNWGVRSVLFPLAGQGRYDYGKMPLRYLMEAPMQAISFVIMVAAIHGVRQLRRTRQRELHAAQLERSLADARLRNLQLQLQPHFLFNALNTISSTMYHDVKAADKMIERLGDLLRLSLRRDPTDEVSLAIELEMLDGYLAIMRARFGDRLEVRVDVAPEIREARLPSLLLQPLVENAIRHGGAERDGSGHVELRAGRDGDDLVIEVHDDGAGAGASPAGTGIGLSTTAERLRLLYGERHTLRAGNRPEGGFRVEVRLPFVTAESRAT